jgi:hypothetical protein
MEGGKGGEAMTTMSPIMRGDVCCGFILRRGRGRIEGYDAYCNPVAALDRERDGAVEGFIER